MKGLVLAVRRTMRVIDEAVTLTGISERKIRTSLQRAVPIRACVVDDQAVIRESLTRFLEISLDVNVVGAFPLNDGAHQVLTCGDVDIILLHFEGDRSRLFSFLKQLERALFQGRVLALVGSLNDSDVLRLVSYGVSGILSQNASSDFLARCIQKVAAGEYWFDQAALSVILSASVQILRKTYLDPFTDREKALIRRLSEGLTNKEIAGHLDMEESAVK